MNRRILRLADVLYVTGLSRSSIYLKIANDQFPKQVSLGSRAVGWREEYVERWMADLPEKR